MARRFRESMKQGLTYDAINVRRREILIITNVPCKYSIVVMLALVIIIIGNIGHEEIARAQDGNVDMNPIIMHIHPHLSVLVNNMPFEVPAQIGIDPPLWKDHSLDDFGMQSMPEMDMVAMAPLHTHDGSGTVHVESTTNRDYTLREFLNIWGLNLDGKKVKMTTDGEPVSDFKEHIFRDGEKIKLEVQ
jgi:hypothetical protein